MRGLEGRHKQVVMAQRVKALQGSPGLAQLVWSLLLEKRLKEAGKSSLLSLPAEQLPLLYAVGAAQRHCPRLSYSSGHTAPQVSPSSK